VRFTITGQENESSKQITFRHIIPSVFTSLHLICGMFSIILAFDGRYVPAAWLILLALFFDSIDGRLARALDSHSQFGLVYDSLSDIISFGVAPAMVMYASSLKDFGGVTGAIVATFFVLCVVLRVARFSITPSSPSGPRPYQGLPCPASSLFLLALIKAGVPVENMPGVVALFMVILGFLSLSSVPYSNIKKMTRENANKKRCYLLLGAVLLSIVIFRGAAPLLFWSVYIIAGVLRFDWDKWLIVMSSPIQEGNTENK